MDPIEAFKQERTDRIKALDGHSKFNLFFDRPWGKGNNPKTAVWEFLKESDQFVADEEIDNKLIVTAAPNGFLKRVK